MSSPLARDWKPLKTARKPVMASPSGESSMFSVAEIMVTPSCRSSSSTAPFSIQFRFILEVE
nr:hypothetical protein [Nocardioides faecalis]